MKAVGIDIGTVNSRAGGRPGGSDDPSVSLCLASAIGSRDGRLVAENRLNPAATGEVAVRHIKRAIGTDDHIEIGGETHATSDVVAKQFAQVREAAAAQWSTEIEQAVVTAPAYWTMSQIDVLRSAAETAGIEVGSVVSEPVAAALNHFHSRDSKAGLTLYVDFGGGTFDVAILEGDHDVLRIVALNGDRALGGIDFDAALTSWMENRLREQGYRLAETTESNLVRRRQRQLMRLAETCKIQLSQRTTVNVSRAQIFPDDEGRPVDVNLSLDRRTFDELTARLTDSAVSLTARTLEKAGLREDDVDQIILVGGATLSTSVQARFGELFRHHDVAHDDVFFGVAKGAAIVAESSASPPTMRPGWSPPAGDLRPPASQPVKNSATAIPNAKPDPTADSAADPSARSAAPDDRTAEIPGGLVDRVHFSVTAPPIVVPGETFLIDVWAHFDRRRNEVIARAKQEYGIADVYIKSRGPIEVARGARLTVRLKLDGLRVDPPSDLLLWAGETGNVTFFVEVPEGAAFGSCGGRATIHIEGMQIAQLPFLLKIGDEKSKCEVVAGGARTHGTAFLSYATEDRDQVLARVQGMQKAMPGMRPFLDVLSLRSGQQWEDELRRVIPASDVFYLFWSSHAQASEWVRKEWQCAIESRGIGFIDPVPLVSPKIVPPPAELASIHFNDWMLAFMTGSQ